MVNILLHDTPPAGWDEFVRGHPDGTPFHLAAWARHVASGLRARGRFVTADRDGLVVGILPLHHVRSVLFGNRLVSSPQAAYGGPVAENREVLEGLVRRAEDEAERLGVRHLELRLRVDPGEVTTGDRWRSSDVHVTLGGPIAADADAILAAVPKKTRADCRKADRALVAEESGDLFPAFHRLFALNQRDLGTPVLPAAFLRAVATDPELAPRVLGVRHEGDTVAACVSFVWRDRIMPYYAGASSAARSLRPNHGLYLNVLRFARREGLTSFDFGRSKRGSGSYDFKRRWGFAESPLAYRYRLVRAEELVKLNPQNPSFKRKIEAWKKLPLWAANLAGPFLSPGLS